MPSKNCLFGVSGTHSDDRTCYYLASPENAHDTENVAQTKESSSGRANMLVEQHINNGKSKGYQTIGVFCIAGNERAADPVRIHYTEAR